MTLVNNLLKALTIKNILAFLGVVGFGYTMFALALFAVGGMFMTKFIDDELSGNYTQVKQDLVIKIYPLPQDQQDALHIASPILHTAPYALMFSLFIMFFYIALFTKFVKPKLNNPFKKSSWTKSQDSNRGSQDV